MANKYWLTGAARIPQFLGRDPRQRYFHYWVTSGSYRAYKNVVPFSAKEAVRALKDRHHQGLRIVKDGEDIRATFRKRGHL